MSVRRLLAAAAVVAAAAVMPTPTTAAPPATCTESSWVAGTVELCDGTLVYRDYVYDDYGADDPMVTPVSQTRFGLLSSTAGDDRYSSDANSADLVAFRMRIVGDELEVSFELNTLLRPDSTLAAFALDADDDPATGGGTWPDLDVSSDGWEVVHAITTGDPDTNTMTGRFPIPGGDTWRVQALTAVAGGPVMNVAFRGTDEQTVTGAFWEDKQAAALRAGDISDFAATVEVDDLRDGVTAPAERPTGFQQRVYTSAHTIGEGVSYEGVTGRMGDPQGDICEQRFQFFGKYQPYGIYIPDQGGPHGVQLAMHGCEANHSSLVDQPGMQANIGDALNRIVVVPLGRGTVGYYSDISERDVLDVLADVERTYAVDPNQVFAGGYSMGGYGTFRFAALYPHRFAGYIAWVGFTGNCGNNPFEEEPTFDCPTGALGNVIDFVGNLRHVPGAMLYSGADELVHVWGATAMGRRFAATEGVPYEWYMHPAADHFTYALADDWRKEAAFTAELTRVDNPARVTYRTDRTLAFPDLGIVHDRAYWASAITPREDGYADLDITSFGCGGEVPTHANGNDAGIDPVPWVSQSRSISGRQPIEQSPRFEATLANLASFTIDVEDACLADADVAYKVTVDGPATVRLSDGRLASFTEAGTFEGTIARRSVQATTTTAAPADPPATLAATGGLAPMLGLFALAAGLVLRARRLG